MITSEKQYHVTRKRMQEFTKALEELEQQVDIDPILKKIQIDGVKSQIQEFKDEIDEYEFLRAGNVNYIQVKSLESLPKALVQARIIKGWTQAELAKKVGLQEQQIQRYEQCLYGTANISRINELFGALELDFYSCNLRLRNKPCDFSPNLDWEKLNKAKTKLQERRTLIELS